jgi:hypothetical protein
MKGDNKYFSEKLDKKIDVIRHTKIKEAPKCLIFQLKRFDYDRTTKRKVKIDTSFDYPNQLNFSSFLNDPSYNQFYYSLQGVIFHGGSANSGHYIYNIFINGKSFVFDDEEISNHSSLQFSAKYLNFQTYLLFYEINENNNISLDSLNIPDSILQEIQNDNEIYFNTFLAFYEYTVELFLKTNNLKLLLKYFFNIFIYSIYNQFCEKFKNIIYFLLSIISNSIYPFLDNFSNIWRIFTDNYSMTNIAQIILKEMLKNSKLFISQFIIKALHYMQSNIASIEYFCKFIIQFDTVDNIEEILNISIKLTQSKITHSYYF